MLRLRPYQEQAKNHAANMLFERGNSLIVAGTGAGKTIMLAAVIGSFYDSFISLHRRRPHILVLVHRNEIHAQNHKKFSLVRPNIAVSEITAERKSLHGHVHFGMVQTVANIMPELERAGSFFDLIVIDEAHHAAASTYEAIITQNAKGKPNAALLGVTATPNRGDELPLIHLFDNYYQITTRFLIDAHYLVRPTFLDLTPEFITENGTEAGHLSRNCRNDTQGDKMLEHLVDVFLTRKEEGKSILFAPSHAFCRRIYDVLLSRGRHPAYLSPELDEASRRAELERFENGDSDELINVDICTEGYDFPPLRNLADFDTNGTHGQWVQKVGRVLRTFPGKTSCTVLDFGGNIGLYPDGVETTVALEGAVCKEKGEKLCEADLFEEAPEEPMPKAVQMGICQSAEVLFEKDEAYTPYHMAAGFESVHDSDFGIVFVACGKTKDCIIVPFGTEYVLFLGDKAQMKREASGDFSELMTRGVTHCDPAPPCGRAVSALQVRLLAPEYPTHTLTWEGANCCICWKAWKDTVRKELTP